AVRWARSAKRPQEFSQQQAARSCGLPERALLKQKALRLLLCAKRRSVPEQRREQMRSARRFVALDLWETDNGKSLRCIETCQRRRSRERHWTEEERRSEAPQRNGCR